MVVGIGLDHNVGRWAALCGNESVQGVGVISCGLWLLLNRLNLRIAVVDGCCWWLAFIGMASVLEEDAAGFVSDVVGIGWVFWGAVCLVWKLIGSGLGEISFGNWVG